jgi:hypothetical protein
MPVHYSEIRFCRLLLGTLSFFLSVRVAFSQSFAGASGSQQGVYAHIQASQLKSTYGYPYYTSTQTGSGLCFIENKGQVHDQFDKAQPDVLFSGTDGEFVFHLKKNGVSYLLSQVNRWKTHRSFNQADTSAVTKGPRIPDSTTLYRLDMQWIGASPNIPVSAQGIQQDFTHYYLSHCPEGITHVRSYRQVKYHQLYSGIDLVWYEKNGQLEYDYQVSAGADYQQIKIAIEGADSIYLSDQGELVMSTPLGIMIQHAPTVWQAGKSLPARWKMDHHIIQFEIDNLDHDLPFVIDPVVRLWGTYYGGGNHFFVSRMFTDRSGHIYMAGGASSQSGIQLTTSGSHQFGFGGAATDALLVKFNAAGQREWGTYYGGNGLDEGMSGTADPSGFVYLSGQTKSTNAIATPGSHQTVFRGGYYFGDAFLVKFNSEGIRQWGTYYGGAEEDRGWSCSTDSLNNVYLGGASNSPNGIATPGSHQSFLSGSAADGFLIKFNSQGVRQWGTYYGGFSYDQAFACITDPNGFVYLAGETFSQSDDEIATPSSHQPYLSGGIYHGDAFLAKFNSQGVRQWGTYYGGLNDEIFGWASSLSTDDSANIYMAACTYSISEIASSTAHQEALGNGFGEDQDAFLVKFNTNGVRQWGTYYGDVGLDYGFSCTTDQDGNVFLTGTADLEPLSTPSNVFATPGSFQPEPGGGRTDAFLVKFNPAGVREWGTYFGGTSDDDGGTCLSDKNGVIYLSGLTYSPTGISTTNGHQPVFSGGISDFNSYLVKLTENVFNTSMSLCANDLPYLWYGQSITTSGHYSTIVTTPQGFDSVILLTLTVISPSQSTTLMDICSNQLPYSWNGIRCDSAGTYVVALTNAAGCDSITILNLTLSDPSFDAIRIFPNPASDFLNVVFQNNNSCLLPITGALRIYNSIGQLIYLDKTNTLTTPFNIRINTGNLAAGLYFIKIGDFTKKILIAK